MPDRIVEVEWEDTLTRHAWSSKDELPSQPWRIVSVGFVEQDNDAGMVLVEAHGTAEAGFEVKDHGCATMIPRSAIREVHELGRKRR